MKDFLSNLRRRPTDEQILTSFPTSSVGSNHYQTQQENFEMNINDTLNEAGRVHNNFVQQYGQALPFYVRTASLLGVMLGREVSPREVAMFELAHAQTRISLNPANGEAYHDMIIASAASKALSSIKTSSFDDALLADVESALTEQLKGN